MKKIFLIVILLFPLSVKALEFPSLASDKAIVYDLTSKKLIYEKNSEMKTSIASLTKILTTITALENISNLDEYVTIKPSMLKGIYWNASVAGLKAGDTLTYKDLLYASILPSGADATQVLALTLAGSTSAFVTKMNDLAMSLKMTNSNFINVTGLDALNQYSTAQDVLKLLIYALKNYTFKEIYTTKRYYLSSGLLVESTIEKYNQKLNLDTSRILGSKSGYTDEAGTCLSSLVKAHDHEFLIITIGAPVSKDSAYNLLDHLSIITYLDEATSENVASTEYFTYELPTFIEQISSIPPSSFSLNLKRSLFLIISFFFFIFLVIPRHK